MTLEFSADTLIQLPVSERKAIITEKAALIDVTNITDESLHKAYRYGKIISSIAKDYIQHQIQEDNQSESILELERQSELIHVQTDKFAEDFINELVSYFEKKKVVLENKPNPSNLFELCGATLLVTSNSVTRKLSTKIGSLLEKISNISPYIISPEIEFDIHITGIDVILLSEDIVKFAQLKTQKNTLTGSQVTRAKKELSLHENSLFIAAFDVASWTFPQDSKIPRIAGKVFWDSIYLDYNLIETHIKNMVLRIDKVFAELAAS
ncbi:hypothetical protein [Brunnivagina elsteri]|uniref:Uncharacterized protein n=1 Tax=Brunnivagina elsteri CCALA 953 TaxID=987040 RepID=A0A2A2TAT4_9CYAN|nr:hypothetical protein [Calothrix elsteri]PAX48300.1 hypothetical protein CK510_28300 [Calothrix elsteri CCALA 953]